MDVINLHGVLIQNILFQSLKIVQLLFFKQSDLNQLVKLINRNFDFLFRYAGRLIQHTSHLSDEYHQKMKNLTNLITYENVSSTLFENIHHRFV